MSSLETLKVTGVIEQVLPLAVPQRVMQLADSASVQYVQAACHPTCDDCRYYSRTAPCTENLAFLPPYIFTRLSQARKVPYYIAFHLAGP